MCRNIRTLFNFEPPASEDEIHAAALQFVRKVSGSNKPTLANVAAFERAVTEITGSTRRLLNSLQTTAAPRDREIEAEKARARAREVCLIANRLTRPPSPRAGARSECREARADRDRRARATSVLPPHG